MAITNLIPWKRRQQDLDTPKGYGNPYQMLSQEMNRWLDDFRTRFDMEPFGIGRGETGMLSPSVDVTEDEKEVRIACELPGIDEKDIDITLGKDSVTIKGEKKQETEDKGKDYYRMERTYGSFQRVVPLPAEIDEDNARADFKKGVLTIQLPKTEEARKSRRKIEVQSG